MSEEFFLESLLQEFIKEKEKNLSPRWKSIQSILLRIWGSQRESDLLLSHESQYMQQMLEWLKTRLEERHVSTKEVRKIVLLLKNYKEHVSERTILLTFVGAAFSLTLAVLLNVFSKGNTGLLLILMNMVFFILIIEKLNIAYSRNSAEELMNLMDYWLKVEVENHS